MVHATIPFVLFASLDAHNSSFLKETGAPTLEEFQKNVEKQKNAGTLPCPSTEHDKESCIANDDCVWKLLDPSKGECEYGDEQARDRRCLHNQPTGGATAKIGSALSWVSADILSRVGGDQIGRPFPVGAKCQGNAAEYCPDFGWRNTLAVHNAFASKQAMEKCCFKTCLNTYIEKKLIADNAVDLYRVGLQRAACDTPITPITDPQTCHAAAIVTKNYWVGEEDKPNELAGCYLNSMGAVFYNKNPKGLASIDSKSRPICASTTSQ